ncbi:MAG: hypothetical protein V1716_05045 [Candidatus Uhrbacteria bacterium]
MRKICLLVAIIFFSCCLSRQVWAFSAAPAVIEISGNRGEQIENKFTLVNESKTEETYYIDTLKFEANDESGTPKFIPYSEDHSELPEWLSFPTKTIKVPAESYIEFPFSVVIPSDIKSGGYYAAITISDDQPTADPKSSTIQTKTALLVFLNVKGENNEQAALLDFTVLPKWNEKLAGTLTYRIQNQGNVYLKPKGTITFKNLFGQTIASIEANPEENKILSETTRKIDLTFDQGLNIGPITAELNLEYGEEQKTIQASTTMWVIPWKILLVGFISILLVIIGLRILNKKKK